MRIEMLTTKPGRDGVVYHEGFDYEVEFDLANAFLNNGWARPTRAKMEPKSMASAPENKATQPIARKKRGWPKGKPRKPRSGGVA